MKYYIGSDIGGTNLRAALFDEDFTLIDKFKVGNEVAKGPEYNLNKLVIRVEERWNYKDIVAVGVGSVQVL